jgi:ribose-phosphate pyrophosphokinase
MVDSGGTLCNAAAALINQGAKSVSAYITHGVLSQNAWQKIANSQLKKLVITNSINPTNHTLATQNIEIIDISCLLATAINNIVCEKSLSALFN